MTGSKPMYSRAAEPVCPGCRQQEEDLQGGAMDSSGMLGYVKSLFEQCAEHNEKFMFRNKYEHTKRVYAWAKRLLECESADEDIVLAAVIFHDAGYTCCEQEHARQSAEICERYLLQANFNPSFIEQVTEIIANHCKKDLIFKPDTSIEQILLIEADCLDESGALSVLRDALSEGMQKGSYESTLERLSKRRIVVNPDKLYCVTGTAKKIWMEKRQLYLDFLESLKVDLVVAEGFGE
jgi:uncharacterized protein